MLKIGEKKEPQKVVLRAAVDDEPEAFVVLAPVTPAMRRRAQRAAHRSLGDADFDAIDVDVLHDAVEDGSRELIRLGLLDWGGIGDADGNLLELTPDRDTRFATANAPDRPTGTIDLLLADEDAFAAIDAAYVRPDAMRRAEKNGLSASPSGTGEAATPASATASSAARRKPKTRPAKSVRTAKTSSKRKPAKRPGKS